MASVGPLQSTKDRFGGITINSKNVCCTSDADFENKLQVSLVQWKEEKVRGVWVKVSKDHASLIPICIKHGFEFHHAQPGYVMLNLWLPEEEPNLLPQYANQYLGCAGFVVNSTGKVLVVKEKYTVGPKAWKLPGGHANPGEEIAEAARREVYEETGIECKFQAVISFRHQHNYRHGCSDLYFVCLMRAMSEDIRPCSQEIAECQWMDIGEYAASADLTDTNRFIVEVYQGMVDRGDWWLQAHPVLSYNKKSYNLIYSVSTLDGTGSDLHAAGPRLASNNQSGSAEGEECNKSS